MSVLNKKTCSDISIYSNSLPQLLKWKVGSKYSQKVSIPEWIKKNKIYTKECLKGLLQTDGSIYNDRGYKMINFVNTVPNLSYDVFKLISTLGYKPNLYKISQKNGKIKHTIRLSKNTEKIY